MIDEQYHTPPMHRMRLWLQEEVRDLIDRAARAHGKTRSDFMIEASRRAAEHALPDQTLVTVDKESFARYVDLLDQPPSEEGFSRLMAAPSPWTG